MKRTVFTVVAVLCLSVASFANIVSYEAFLTGAESGSTGTGFATVTINDVANTMEVVVSFSGLTTGTTASHIHCCTTVAGTGSAGVATTTPSFTGFPLGVTSGTFDNIFDLTLASSYNPAFVTAHGNSVAQAETDLLAAMAVDKTYLNIHTSKFPGGEISGFLVPVPEPATMTLMAGGILGFLAKRRNALRK